MSRITSTTKVLTPEQSQKLTEQRIADPEWKGSALQAEKFCLGLLEKDTTGWNSMEWDECRVNPVRGGLYWRIMLKLERRIADGSEVFREDYKSNNVYLSQECGEEGIEYIRKYALPEITRQKCQTNAQLDLFKNLSQMSIHNPRD